MNRRAFFAAVAAGLAATIDPERRLWVPGRKLISIPKPTVAVDQGNPSVEVIEFWWEIDGKCYRRVQGEHPEEMPFPRMPFVRLDGLEIPPSGVTMTTVMSRQEFAARYPAQGKTRQR